MHEQNGGDRPDTWAAWTTPAGQGDEVGSRRPAASASAGQDQPEPPATPPASVTQPLTNPAQAGFGQPDGGGYGGPPPGYGYQHYGGYGGPPGGGYGYPAPPGYGGPPPPRRRRGLATIITYVAVAALAATAGGLAVSFVDSGNNQPGASSGPSGGFGVPGNGSPGASANPGAAISAATARKVETAVEPGMVIISGTLGFAGNNDAGTGMIISKSGLVLTNNHVINQTTGLSARVVGTNAHYQAKWLGYDQSADIAVLQLENAHGLPTVPLGDSSKVKVGDLVIGIGNANGTGFPTPAPGSITGINQTITASDQGGGAAPERLTGMLETDAEIVSGDSGGPLASTNGKVIGMDTAASSNSFATGATNVGFAIPINKAMTIAHQIISGKGGSGVQIGTTGFVGVLVAGGPNGAQSNQTSPQGQLRQQEQKSPLPSPNRACVANSVQANTVPQTIAPVSSGTLVLGVICGTPADQVGLQPGDVITRVAGHQISSPASLMSVLHTFHGGSRISVTWVTQSGHTVSRTLTVASAPPN